jgi:hypothetical protein
MRYRRENKELVLRHKSTAVVKGSVESMVDTAPTQAAAAVAAAATSLQLADAAAVEAAVAAAESFGRAMDEMPSSWNDATVEDLDASAVASDLPSDVVKIEF